MFDENLRDIAVEPESMRAACEELRNSLLNEQDLDIRARMLAQLGSFQRILNNLQEAEDCHVQCLKLLNELNASPSRVIQKFPKNFLNEGRKKLDFISLLDLNFFPVGHRQWFQGTTA